LTKKTSPTIDLSLIFLSYLNLLDLFTAYDTIDHSILLHRLSSWFGFDGEVISWLTSYLSSRSFVVFINSIFSAHSPFRQSAPQG